MSRHPRGWPNTDASHRIVRTMDGEHRCEWCDCRPAVSTAQAPCEHAPTDWRARERSGESATRIRRTA